MHGSELEDGQDSTPEEDPRPKLWRRFLAALALLGLLVGLMLGRLTAPEPVTLEQVEALPDGLQIWFSGEPKVSGEHLHGALVLLFEADGRAQHGQLQLAGKGVNWRLIHSERGLLLNLVAARPLRGEWHGAAVEGRWRLRISLRAE